ncbi:phage tail protein [Pseudomonas quasicaspiana]|uniref:phage tail protein n=1 Tax=Pseudomonas quasicaspiana TaxID=2829821 RepID=UPI001E470D02|nr:phage tail protein [Pseudomonas quasicaspiana]MCD5980523.1 tail fiber protein [Pseudomonas quasicaspiana]
MDFPKSVPNVGLVDGKFVDENTASGQVGSLIPSSWGNAVTDELLNVIRAANLSPNEADNNQLLKAIQALTNQNIKNAVRVATTIAIALSGAQTIDDVFLVEGDRVLVKNQAAAAQNGIYVVSAGPWVRSTDADENAEVTPGMFLPVAEGKINGDSLWQLVTDAPIVLGTTALSFEMLSGKTGVSGTFFGVSVDKYGRVVAGQNPKTLAGFGIGDTYTKTEIEALIAKASSLPVGSMVLFPTSSVPAGFIEVDNSLFQDTVYPELATFLNKKYNLSADAAGWTRLPESRGEHLRFWDHGRNVDPGRVLGSWQKGTFHSVGALPTTDSVSDFAAVTGATAHTELGLDEADLALYPAARTGNGGGSGGLAVPGRNDMSYGVMRPRNVAFMLCIKAWNAPVNQGNIDIAALAALVAQLVSGLDVSLVYPGGGDATTPGTIARSAYYIVPNPFPGRKVKCQLELLYNGQWVEVYQNSSDDNYYGALAGQQSDGDIRVITASLALLSSSGNRGTFPQHTYNGTIAAHVTAALPARVWVSKTKGQL